MLRRLSAQMFLIIQIPGAQNIEIRRYIKYILSSDLYSALRQLELDGHLCCEHLDFLHHLYFSIIIFVLPEKRGEREFD